MSKEQAEAGVVSQSCTERGECVFLTGIINLPRCRSLRPHRLPYPRLQVFGHRHMGGTDKHQAQNLRIEGLVVPTGIGGSNSFVELRHSFDGADLRFAE